MAGRATTTCIRITTNHTRFKKSGVSVLYKKINKILVTLTINSNDLIERCVRWHTQSSS